MAANREGRSNDPRADAAVRFGVKVARERGHVSDLDLSSVKAAGYDDAQVIEIVQHVALNVLTNYIGATRSFRVIGGCPPSQILCVTSPSARRAVTQSALVG
jgi:alkylhydroperoxidase family enzyme